MRTKNNVYSNSIISNIYIIDEILLFDFQFAHIAHSLAAAASKCHYNIANLAEPWSTHAVVLHVVVIFVIVTSSHTRPPVAAGDGGLECEVG